MPSRRRKYEYHISSSNSPDSSASIAPTNPDSFYPAVAKVSRRTVIGIGAAAAVVAVAGGVAAFLATRPPSQPTTGTTPTATATGEIVLRTNEQSYMVDENKIKAFKEQVGIQLEADIRPIDEARAIMLDPANASRYDIYGIDTSSLLAVKAAGVTRNYPPSDVPRWVRGPIDPIFTSPETSIGTKVPPPLGPTGEYIAKSMMYPHMWAASPDATNKMDDYGQKGKLFFVSPIDWNYDSVLWNPKFINLPYDPATGISTGSWGVLVDRQYKGRVGFQDIPTISTNHYILIMLANKLIEPLERGPNDLTPTEMKKLVDWLIDHKKAGQFRVFWNDFAQIVSLHVQEEIWVSDGWQPVEMYVRHSGGIGFYLEPNEGYRCWLDGCAPTIATPHYNAVMKYIDWKYSGWFAQYKAKWLGYYTPNWESDEVKNAMGPEFWGWFYKAEPTFIEVPVEKHAAFDPISYEWKMSGSPNPKGYRRDGGDITRHNERVSTWQRWPHDADAYIQEWTRLRAA